MHARTHAHAWHVVGSVRVTIYLGPGMRTHPHARRCRSNWVGESLPCLTYGMRGMISLSIAVQGPLKDVHSGNDGGVFCEVRAGGGAARGPSIQRHGLQAPGQGVARGPAPGPCSCCVC